MISDALDAYLVATDDEREPDGFWHPSSLFSCRRQAAYQQRGVPRSDVKAPKDHRPLALGKAYHTILQAAVTHQADIEAIAEAYHEVKVFIPTFGVKGSADSVVFLDDGTVEVEEFKSIKTAAVRFSKKEGGWKPKEEHVNQGFTYAYGIRHFPWHTAHIDPSGREVLTPHEPLGGKLTRLRLTYITKDDAEVMEYVYPISTEWEAWFENYMKDLISTEGLPDRLPEKNWLCKGYCEWRSVCWGE